MDQFCEWFSETEMDDIGNVTGADVAPRLDRRQCIGDDTTLYDFLLLGLATTIVSVLGVFGNALSALVLLRSQFRSSVNFLLLGLTLSDTIVIVYTFATFALPSTFGYFNFWKFYNYSFFPLISPYFFPIASIGQTGSVYFCVAVTVERYVVVCWPLYAKSWCTNKRARSYTIIVFLFSVLINLPKWFEIEAQKVEIYGGGGPRSPQSTVSNVSSVGEWNSTLSRPLSRSCFLIQSTPLRKNSVYTHYYVNWNYFVFMYAIPFILLVTLNLAIYKRIKVADRRRSILTRKGDSRETSVSKMLLCVVIVFLACNFLAMFNNILEVFMGFNCNTLVNLSNFFVLFNSCCNFAIYYIFGQKFRSCFILTWNDLCPCMRLRMRVQRNHLSSRSIRTETMELVNSPTTITTNQNHT